MSDIASEPSELQLRIVAIILNRNRATLTADAVMSVLDQVDRVMIVDNASDDTEFLQLESFSRRHDVMLVRNDRNLGYAAGNNIGIGLALEAGFDALLIMNNDATAEPGAVRLLAGRLLQCSALAAVGPTVVEMDHPEVVVHTACRLSPRNGMVDRGRLRTEIRTEAFSTEAISGAAFLARATAFRECGGFDERFGFYFEDTEWSARVQRANWKLEVVPRSVFRHAVGGSMPSVAGNYYRARNRPIYLRVGLGQSRPRAAIGSAAATAIAIMSLMRRGHPWTALRAVLAGWLVGVFLRD
jgi:GT2 family glycosyltransferase